MLHFLFDLPLAVLEVPGAGYLHDFVSSGAAIPLESAGPISHKLSLLFEPVAQSAAVERYLADTLAVRSGASERLVELILQLLAERP